MIGGQLISDRICVTSKHNPKMRSLAAPSFLFLFVFLFCHLTLAEETASQYHAHVYCDDVGELFVNGNLVLKMDNWTKPFEAALKLKKGDVITAIVKDAQGGPGGAFSILVLRDNKNFLDVKDFRYATDPKPGWQTNPSMAGFRRPEFSPLTTISLANVKNLQKAWTEPKDRRFGTVYFKTIVR